MNWEFCAVKNHSQLKTDAMRDKIPTSTKTDKYRLYYVVCNHRYSASKRTVRVPSSASSIYTFTVLPGSTSSISSGHSMKQSAPL